VCKVDLAEDVASWGGRTIGSVQWTCCSEYTVKEAYLCLSEDHVDMVDGVKDVWNPLVPLKMSTLAWGLILKRLPTKDTLCERGVRLYSSLFCVGGCGKME
jgi:hypothetical protein